MDTVVAAWIITGVVAFLPIARVLLDLRKEDHFPLLSLAGVALFVILFWPLVVMYWGAHRRNLQGAKHGYQRL
jgi:hypothetical protein